MTAGIIYNTQSPYQNGKIYKITSPSTDLMYIGSTTQSLKTRFANHISNCFNRNSVKSAEIIKFNNASIELIEDYPCNTKKDLELREAYHIKTNKNQCVNKAIPRRTKRQYWLDNKDEIDEYRGFQIDCYCGGKYTLKHKTTHFKTDRHLNYLAKCQ